MLYSVPRPGETLQATMPQTGEQITVRVIRYAGDGWVIARQADSLDAPKMELHEDTHKLRAV